MSLLSAAVRVRSRRAVWVLPVAMLVWSACSDNSGPSNSDDTEPQAGAHAGNGSNGGCANASAASAYCAGGVAGGPAAGTGAEAGAVHGEAGVGGVQEIAGAAGTETAGEGGAGGGGAAGASAFVPAPHAPFPWVTAHGGPVLKNIQIVPVYFGDDPLFNDLERFNSWIVTSDYWKHAGAEYGVEAGTRLPAIRRPSAPTSTISDTQIAAWIDAWVTDQTLPKPNANTVFVLFFQSGTTITNWTGQSCHAFAGLHETAALSNPVFSGDVPFVIIPRCTYSAEDDPLMIATNVASHEYIESATNPFNFTTPGWLMDNDSGPLEAWGMLSGPAVADLCLSQSYDVVEGFTVQDIWSNAAAHSDMNPCQPSDPKHPYFSVSAEQTIYHAQPGTTLTIHARAWSNLSAPDWEIAVNWGYYPYSDFDGQAELSRERVNNGDELTATVTVPEHPQVTDGRSQYRFTIDSIDPINPNFAHSWPFLIVVP